MSVNSEGLLCFLPFITVTCFIIVAKKQANPHIRSKSLIPIYLVMWQIYLTELVNLLEISYIFVNTKTIIKQQTFDNLVERSFTNGPIQCSEKTKCNNNFFPGTSFWFLCAKNRVFIIKTVHLILLKSIVMF